MYTAYHNLPDNSRVWIYQAERELTETEISFINDKAIDFINQWTRHGDDLKGSFTIKYNQFLIVAVDESFNNVSGCSIDASVRFIQQLQDHLNVDFMDKMKVTFKVNDNINIVQLADFQKYAKSEKITGDTIVFNNLISTKADVSTNWEIPAKQSWHKRFLV
jgi:hypothetical protein